MGRSGPNLDIDSILIGEVTYRLYKQTTRSYKIDLLVEGVVSTISIKVTNLEDAIKIAEERVLDIKNNLHSFPIRLSKLDYIDIIEKITTSGRYGITLHSDKHMKHIKNMLNTTTIPFEIDEMDHMIYNTNIYKRIETDYSYKYIKIKLDK